MDFCAPDIALSTGRIPSSGMTSSVRFELPIAFSPSIRLFICMKNRYQTTPRIKLRLAHRTCRVCNSAIRRFAVPGVQFCNSRGVVCGIESPSELRPSLLCFLSTLFMVIATNDKRDRTCVQLQINASFETTDLLKNILQNEPGTL